MENWSTTILALLGVVVGFALNEISVSLREIIKSKKYKSALDDELNTNLHQIKQKKDIASR